MSPRIAQKGQAADTPLTQLRRAGFENGFSQHYAACTAQGRTTAGQPPTHFKIAGHSSVTSPPGNLVSVVPWSGDGQ